MEVEDEILADPLSSNLACTALTSEVTSVWENGDAVDGKELLPVMY